MLYEVITSAKLRKNISAYVMVISLLLIFTIFSILVPRGVLTSPRNIAMLARETTITAILAMGMMFVIVAGHIDLSVGSLMGFCGTRITSYNVCYTKLLRAKVLCGGDIPENMPKGGNWITPCVLYDVTPNMRVYSEEIFGPVLPIILLNKGDDAALLGNDTEYGLAAYVFTSYNFV